jgi:hypothetical protein
LEKKTIDKEEALQSILRKIFDVLYFKKGLSQEIDLAFFTCMVKDTVGLNSGTGLSFKFLGAPMIL